MSNNPQVVIGVSAVDTSKTVLDQFDQRVQHTANTVDQAGNRMVQKSNVVASAFKQNFTQIGMTVAGLGAGIVGYASSFDTLAKSQLAVDRANLNYKKSLQSLNDVMHNTKSSAADVANAQEKVRLASERAKLAQDDLGDTFTNFYAQMPGQIISFGMAASSVLTMIRGQQLATAATTVSSAATYDGALMSMNTSNVATTVSTNGLSMAMKAAFLSNPITLPLVIIAGLITAIAFNVGGLRDRFFELGKGIYEFFNKYFKPLADAMAWFYNNVLKPISDVLGGPAPAAAEEFATSIDQVAVATQEAVAELADFDSYMQDIAQDSEDAKSSNLMYLESVGKLALAVGLTNDELGDLVDYLKDTERATADARRENFKLVADVYGLNKAMSMTSDQLTQTANNYRELQKSIDDTTSSIRNLTSAQDDNRSKNKSDEETAGVTYSTKRGLPTSGNLAEARAKYPGMSLAKVGSRWVPQITHSAKLGLESAQSALSMFERHAGTIDTRAEGERLNELRSNVETARNRYAEALAQVQVVINNNADGSQDVEVAVNNKRRAQLRSRRQTVAGSALR